jgi:HK97 family phage major capsid protein
MDAKLKELQDQKNKLSTEIRELGDKQAEWTAEHRGQWESLNKSYDETTAALAARKEELTNSEAVQARLKQIEADRKAATNDAAIGFDGDRRREENPERIAKRASEVHALALQAWMRADAGMDIGEEHRSACRQLGVNLASKEMQLPARVEYGSNPAWSVRGKPMQREIRVGLDVATSGAGLETIPEGFMMELERRMLAFGSVRQVCRVIRTATGNALPWPKVDDTSNTGVLLAEATTFGTSVDPTFSAVTFNAYKYSSKPVFVSYEILRDSAFNLSSLIADMLGERLGRIEGSETTTANGSAKPNGIVNAAGTGVTSASATAFTADELIDLVHSLDPAYRNGPSVGFMFHDTALKYLRKFKDANGQYLWQPGMSANEPDTVYGYPYTVNQAMEPLVSNVPVTAKKHVLFGDFSKFVIRDVATPRFRRLDERYADTDQVAFIAFKELDSDTIRAEALKVLLQS